jgi:hypothetical protein
MYVYMYGCVYSLVGEMRPPEMEVRTFASIMAPNGQNAEVFPLGGKRARAGWQYHESATKAPCAGVCRTLKPGSALRLNSSLLQSNIANIVVRGGGRGVYVDVCGLWAVGGRGLLVSLFRGTFFKTGARDKTDRQDRIYLSNTMTAWLHGISSRQDRLHTSTQSRHGAMILPCSSGRVAELFASPAGPA